MNTKKIELVSISKDLLLKRNQEGKIQQEKYKIKLEHDTNLMMYEIKEKIKQILSSNVLNQHAQKFPDSTQYSIINYRVTYNYCYLFCLPITTYEDILEYRYKSTVIRNAVDILKSQNYNPEEGFRITLSECKDENINVYLDWSLV